MTGPAVVTVRPAAEPDAGPAARIARDAYRHYTERIGHPPAPMTADYAGLARSGTMWIAEDDGRPVGLLVLVDEPGHLLVSNIAVDPSAQGRGVGARLLEFADEQARLRGHREIRLYTNEAMTENIAWYPRHGFVETHRAEQNGFRRVFFTRTLD